MTRKEPPSRLQRFLNALASYAFRDKLPNAEIGGRDVIPPPSVYSMPLIHRYCVMSGSNGVMEMSRVEVRKDPATGTLIKLTFPALRVVTGEIIA